ncbi:MAG: hypothetical protein L0191_15305 [Acidobacteria bacterium]|nr:hypothetical protein [Acidobacteriota bacterium]
MTVDKQAVVSLMAAILAEPRITASTLTTATNTKNWAEVHATAAQLLWDAVERELGARNAQATDAPRASLERDGVHRSSRA